MMFLPEIIEEADPDQTQNRRMSTTSNKSEGKFNPLRDKLNDSLGIIQWVDIDFSINRLYH